MNKVVMVTGNSGKWKVASEIFKKYNITLEQVEMNIPEIQSNLVEEVSKFSSEYASRILNIPVIKSDVGYYIEELGGFPGPFLKYINNMLTSEDILKMMERKKNRKILLKECLTLSGPNIKTKQFVNIEEATIALNPMGEGTIFDRIVIFKGYNYPKALNTPEENIKHFESVLGIYDDMAKYIDKL